MTSILYDASKIKVFESVMALGEFAGESSEWCDALWNDLRLDEELFQEMVYYLEHHTLSGNVSCQGYSMIDLFVYEMDKYNLLHDTGKNTAACNKEKMILHTFHDMCCMKKDPQAMIKRMQEGRGMDK